MIFDIVAHVAVTPTLQILGAYSAGDVVGGLLTFAIPGANKQGWLTGIRIADDDDEKAAGTLYVFNDAPTAIADADAFAAGTLDADLDKLLLVKAVAAGDYTTLNNNAYVHFRELNQLFKANDKGNLYAYFVCTATPTYTAATDLTFILDVLTQ